MPVSEAIVAAVREARAAGTVDAAVTAVRAIAPEALAELFHASLAGSDDVPPLTTGLAASPGAAVGRIVLSADAAVAAADAGEPAMLVRPETTPDDVVGMQAARGILTSRGGLVSHAAVVARGWGIPAVVGATEVGIDGDTVRIGDTTLRAGDRITIDGSTGHVYAGALATVASAPPAELDVLLRWADEIAAAHVEVRANADTEGDATVGRRMGARGIGLCRTEHMFLSHDRLPIMRRFILAHDAAAEAAALSELESAQTHDFERVLDAMDGLPVTVRLLDPPLHEFLPDIDDLAAREARGELDGDGRAELTAARRLHETNPMIGTRGVRLALVRSGLYQMQVRALCTAAAGLFAAGKRPHVEIMVPLVVDPEELRIARGWVRDVLDEIGHPELSSTVITVGAMIETPRAALLAGALADHADFFSIGTNDLTQMTYAFSRDDVEARLLPAYQAMGILPANPFAVLDQQGVGELVRIGHDAARRAKPTIKIGVCGEHAGDPSSAAFLVGQGVDSVSCSPFRVPLARLAVAQALLACGRADPTQVHVDVTGPDGATDDADDSGANGTDRAADGVLDVDETLVLHVLRVRGFVTAAGFQASLGTHPSDLLDDLAERGLVRHIPAREMYALLPAGREHHAALLGAQTAVDLRARLAGDYARFLDVNERFKQLCTDWQVRNGEPNDHADADYDRGCIERLAALHAEAAPVIAALAGVLPRLERYTARLAAAADRVARGESKRFTGVMCESFHDVWMELHEDLIVLQGIDRTAEGSF